MKRKMVNFKRSLKISILCLVFSGYSIFSQDPNFHIYLCFGQSNMEGNATIEDQDKTGVSERFKVMSGVNCPSMGREKGKWYTAVPPLCRCGTGLTPVDYFGRTLVDSLPENITIGVINVAIGGCAIEIFDKVNYASYIATAADWLQNYAREYDNNPYGRLIELGKLAQKDGVIKGILLHQGESNSGQQDWPQKVKGVYDNLIKDLGLDPTQTPLLVGEVVADGSCKGHNNVIAKVPNVIPNSHVISSQGLTQRGDGLHFDAKGYRAFGKRYAEKMLTLLPVVKGKAPVVSITSPKDNGTFTTLDTVTFSAEASDEDGTITKVSFYDGTTLLDSAISAPYTVKFFGLEAGNRSITAKAIDNDGQSGSSKAITIVVTAKQGAFNGKPHDIPGRIEAEEFDIGGEGVAYHESSDENEGRAAFRNDPVDIEETDDTSGTYNISYILDGEWLEYTVLVEKAGVYELDLRVAAEGEGKSITVSIDDVDISENIAIPATGGWQTWSTVTVKDIS
ncbi:MAG: sialate O-acetylesterase, partial [Fibrobacter sp.]|nr:sialate O-acetylesterase [Fibrobacter sp.]